MSDADYHKVRGMGQIGCTAVEIAGVMDISTDTLVRRLQERGWKNFAEFHARESAKGDVSLRRMQHKLALGQEPATLADGTKIPFIPAHPQMLMWLGRQRLGQSEHPVVTPDGDLQVTRITRRIIRADDEAALLDGTWKPAIEDAEVIEESGPDGN